MKSFLIIFTSIDILSGLLSSEKRDFNKRIEIMLKTMKGEKIILL